MAIDRFRYPQPSIPLLPSIGVGGGGVFFEIRGGGTPNNLFHTNSFQKDNSCKKKMLVINIFFI